MCRLSSSLNLRNAACLHHEAMDNTDLPFLRRIRRIAVVIYFGELPHGVASPSRLQRNIEPFNVLCGSIYHKTSRDHPILCLRFSSLFIRGHVPASPFLQYSCVMRPLFIPEPSHQDNAPRNAQQAIDGSAYDLISFLWAIKYLLSNY